MLAYIKALVVMAFVAIVVICMVDTATYDHNHVHTETCAIVYQHDNSKEGWSKFPLIQFQYNGKVYETKIFYTKIDLSKKEVICDIFTDDSGDVYKTNFLSYK